MSPAEIKLETRPVVGAVLNAAASASDRAANGCTTGYSKKLENHRAAVALWIAFYNFCRVHETLRCTPAMALGVTDHIWSVAELVSAALEPSDVPPLPTPAQPTTLRPSTRRFRLIVRSDGKGTNMPR